MLCLWPAEHSLTPSALLPHPARYPPGHPLAWLEEEAEEVGAVSEARRRELVELGFPDDGYDYIRHMRTLGANAIAGVVPGAPAPASAKQSEEVNLGALRLLPLPLPPPWGGGRVQPAQAGGQRLAWR